MPPGLAKLFLRLPQCLLMVCGGAACAQQPLVEVYLPAAPDYELAYSLSQARRTVTAIYADIGVRIAWRPITSREPRCAKTYLHSSVVVAFGSASRQYNDSVFGYSKPYDSGGPCVMLLMDRLRDAVKRNPISTGFLLGHVLAHEIGHVLEGSAHHAETGVMKARWSLHETANMRVHLRFADEDVECIRDALGRRF